MYPHFCLVRVVMSVVDKPRHIRKYFPPVLEGETTADAVATDAKDKEDGAEATPVAAELPAES